MDPEGSGAVLNPRVARDIAAAQDGFELTREGPVAALSTETTMLRQRIASAILAMCEVGQTGGGPVTLSRPSGRRRLEVLVVPVSRDAGLPGDGETGAMVFVSDPETQIPTDIDALRTLYHLTPAEARLAAGLTRGCTLVELAGEARITHENARCIVKQVLHKTGTHTQAQAVSLILRGVARVCTLR